MYWADQSSQDRIKVSCTSTTSPANQTRKDPFSFVLLSPHTPQFQLSVGATSLWWSLGSELTEEWGGGPKKDDRVLGLFLYIPFKRRQQEVLPFPVHLLHAGQRYMECLCNLYISNCIIIIHHILLGAYSAFSVCII